MYIKAKSLLTSLLVTSFFFCSTMWTATPDNDNTAQTNNIMLKTIANSTKSSTGFSFIADSDIHCTGVSSLKPKHPEIIQKLILSQKFGPIGAVILPGDLTDTGAALGRYCYVNYTAEQDQWGQFEREWLNALEPLVSVYDCPGNHDTYGGSWCYQSPALTRIENRHNGNTYYSCDKDGLHFICCGIYPDLAIRTWLLDDLKKVTPQTPIVLFFHYNPIGDMSNWWCNQDDSVDNTKENIEQKNAFYDIIKNYNIIGIFVGHWHYSYETSWRGIRVFGVGGESFALSTYAPETGKLEVRFIDENETIIPSASLFQEIAE